MQPGTQTQRPDRGTQFRQDGKTGNVDLRPGFPFRERQIVLVGANNRSNDTLVFWEHDPATRRLPAPISAAIPTATKNYGFTMYHSAVTGKSYAFVTQETGTSTMEQYELSDNGAGQVGVTEVRSFAVGSVTEGCVADDDLGALYVRQEDVALWRYGAEPGIDVTTGTDGLDITTANLGPGFGKGAPIVHDGYNSGGRTSNLTYVPLT